MPSKLKLQLDDLVVDTFTTEPVQREKGTVYGEACTCYTACTCPGCPSCDASCNGTCDAACGPSYGGTCDYTCDYTCGGATCDATCEGWATYAGPHMECQICGGGGGTA